MNCDGVHKRVADYLGGDLPAAEALELRGHLEGCDVCRSELADLSDLWLRLGLVPDEEPSEQLRERFYAALGEATIAESRKEAKPWRQSLSDLFGPIQMRRLAIAVPSLALGVGLGLAAGWMGSSSGSSQVAAMRQEVDSLSRLVTVSLLQQDSASDRLKGVSFGRATAARDEGVLEALIAAATRDPSVNVRLAAIDALSGIRQTPRVGDQLEASLVDQRSPLVQMAVIEYLFNSQPTRQREITRRLLDDDALDEAVKEYLASQTPQI
jgi:hypothetical protein